MTTLASDAIRAYAAAWDAGIPSAVLSGIVGDKAHAAGGGYHLSIEDNRAGNYSVTRPMDAAPPGNWSRRHASAVDMSMSTQDMINDWNRVYAVWVDHSDPRRKYFNAYNGWNGIGDAERLDFIANTRKVTTADHKWHGHDETPRAYWDDPFAFNAKLSVHLGESKADYVARVGGGGDMGAAENADQAHWNGGTVMGPAVPEQYQVLRMPSAGKVPGQSFYGNAQNDRLYYIQRMLEDIRGALGVAATGDQVAGLTQLVKDLSQRPPVVLDDGVAESIANQIVALAGGATPEEVRRIVVEELDNERRDEAGRLLGPNEDEATRTMASGGAASRTVNVPDSGGDTAVSAQSEVAPGQTAEERAAAETPKGTDK